MLNSAVFNFAGKSQILRFIYHKLDFTESVNLTYLSLMFAAVGVEAVAMESV